MKFQNARFAEALQSGPLGSLSDMERGSADALFRIAPIGLAFASDPGRAFQVGAETAALADADFNSYPHLWIQRFTHSSLSQSTVPSGAGWGDDRTFAAQLGALKDKRWSEELRPGSGGIVYYEQALCLACQSNKF